MAEREKSALYPGATWAECIELIKKISYRHYTTNFMYYSINSTSNQLKGRYLKLIFG